MSGVDDNIVSMTFDNESFEKRLDQTIKSLDKLTESLKFSGAERGFGDVAAAANHFDISHMAAGIENVSSKFTALGAIGFSVIQNLTSDVLGFAKDAASKIIDPIIEGGKTRAQNIEQAKFQFRGLGIDVDKAMQSSLDAVKGTAYGLGDAAKVAAQFGASGIQAGDQMTAALRGIAGAAAMTGTSFQEMGDIFTGSAGSGKVNNMDLQQFATRGLNAAAAVGKVMGKTEAQIHEMAAAGQLDFKTFADAMDKAFGAHATQANETYSGSLANMHAALSRLGASIFTPRMQMQRDLFNALTPVIDNVTKSLQPLIGVFLEMERVGTAGMITFLKGIDLTNFSKGITIISAGLGNVFNFFEQLKQIAKDAFQNVFPASSVSTFVTIAQAFKDFTDNLKMGGTVAGQIGDIFTAFFATLQVGWTIIKELAKFILSLTGNFDGAGHGALGAADNFASLIIRLDWFLVQGGGIHKFFVILGDVIQKPVEFVKALVDALQNAAGFVVDFFKAFAGSDQVGAAVDNVGTRFSTFGFIISRVAGVIALAGYYIINWLKHIGSDIASALQPGDFNNAVDAVNVGLLGGIAYILKKFLDNGLKLDFSNGLVDKIKGTLDGVTKSLTAMQTNLKASALLKIAGAVGILAAAVLVLSTIDSTKLTTALTGMSVMFGELVGSMALMDKAVGSTKDAGKIGILAGALIALSTAMVILATAIKILSGLSWGELAKGLTGVGAGLVLLVGATQLMTADVSGLMRAGVAMGLIAAAMYILAQAVQAFATMSWGDMAKGLVGVAAGLGLIIAAVNFMPAGSMLAAGAAMVPLAIGLNILAGAVKLFSMMSWGDMAKGLVGIGLALVGIAGAMQLMPVTLPITAAGMILLGVGLNVIAGAVKIIGGMDLGTLAKGLGGLAVVLGLLAIAMGVMQSEIGGAATLVLISGSLLVLAGVLKVLGDLSLAQLATGIGAIAAVLALLGVAAVLLGPLTPALLGVGAALALLGAAFALFGAGAFLVAEAFKVMADAGVVGAKAFVESIKVFLQAIPMLATTFLKSIVDSVAQLGKSADLLVRVVGVLLTHMLEVIIQNVPKIAEALAVIITAALALIRDKFPDIVETGFEMMVAFLSGARDHIGEITTLVADIVINFLDALSKKIPDLVDAVFNFFMTMITEVAFKLGESATAFIPVGQAFIDGLISGLVQNLANLLQWFIDLPGKVIDIVEKAFGINSPSTKFMDIGVNLMAGLLNGLVGAVVYVMNWFIALPGKVFDWIGDTSRKLLSKGVDLLAGLLEGIIQKALDVATWLGGLAVKAFNWLGSTERTLLSRGIDFISGLLTGMGQRAFDMMNWLIGLGGQIFGWVGDLSKLLIHTGEDIIKGLWNGMTGMLGWFGDKLGGIGGFIKDHKGPIEKDRVLLTPIGQAIMEGLVQGIQNTRGALSNVLDAVTNQITDNNFGDKLFVNFSESLAKIHENIGQMDSFNPVITPVLDLSKVKAAAGTLDSMMSVTPIVPVVSIDQARQIATTADLTKTATDAATPAPTQVSFEQNIYAPQALSTNDIYRNTKSQIALAKEELSIS